MTHPTERVKMGLLKRKRPHLKPCFPCCISCALLAAILPPSSSAPYILTLNFLPMVISLQVVPQPDAPHHHEYCLFSSAYLQVHPPPTATLPASHMSPAASTTPLPPCFPHLGFFGVQKRACWAALLRAGLIGNTAPTKWVTVDLSLLFSGSLSRYFFSTQQITKL